MKDHQEPRALMERELMWVPDLSGGVLAGLCVYVFEYVAVVT